MFKLGSDPELMLRNQKTKELVSAIPIITEGKGEGRLLDGIFKNRVIHDNVLVELNTKPADSEDEFVEIMAEAIKSTNDIVKVSGLELHLQASAEFPAKELQCEESRIFGCDPDFNAWKLEINEVPAGASERPFRSAGGHLHVGMSSNEPLNAILADDYGKVSVVKALDVFCGITSVFIDKDDTAPARRALYGGAGAHRPKSYGVEYRALGNWWLRSPKYARLVYQLTTAAMTCLVSGEMAKIIEAIGESTVQRVIDKSKTEQALKIYKKHIAPHLSAETAALVDEVMQEESSDFLAAWSV